MLFAFQHALQLRRQINFTVSSGVDAQEAASIDIPSLKRHSAKMDGVGSDGTWCLMKFPTKLNDDQTFYVETGRKSVGQLNFMLMVNVFNNIVFSWGEKG